MNFVVVQPGVVAFHVPGAQVDEAGLQLGAEEEEEDGDESDGDPEGGLGEERVGGQEVQDVGPEVATETTPGDDGFFVVGQGELVVFVGFHPGDLEGPVLVDEQPLFLRTLRSSFGRHLELCLRITCA